MPRLPEPGKDAGTWGGVLNEYLSTSIGPDGVLKTDSVGAPQLKPNSVTNVAIGNGTLSGSKLADDSITGAKIADNTISVDKLQRVGQSNGIASLNGDAKIPESHVPERLSESQLVDTISQAVDDTLAMSSRTVLGPRWVFDGDSITIGGQTSSVSGGGQNRNSTWTQQMTGFAMGSINYLNNAAVAGQRLDNALARFDANVAPYTPNTVLLTIGTNDIGQGRTIEQFFSDLQTYYEKCIAINARLVLGAIWPTISDTPTGRAAAVRSWNRQLFTWAAAKHIDLIPWDQLSDPATGGWPASWTSDLIHPGLVDSYSVIGKFGADFLANKLGPKNAVRRGTSQPDNLVNNGFGTEISSTLSSPTISNAVAGSAGTLSAGSYSYKATARTFWGETLPSAERVVTVGANGSVTITLTSPTGNRYKKLYRKAPGETTWRLMAELTATASSFVDDGSATLGTEVPSIDTAMIPTGLTAGSTAPHKTDGIPVIRSVDGIRGNVYHLTPYEGTTNDFNDYLLINASPGDTLEITLLARSSGPDLTKHIIRFRSAIPSTIGNYILAGTRLSNGWRLLTGRVTVPADTATIRMSFEGSSGLDWAEVAEVFARKV